MISSIFQKVVGSKNERVLKKLQPLVDATNAFEPEMKRLNDDALKNKTVEFKQRIDGGESLDTIYPRPLQWCGKLP